MTQAIDHVSFTQHALDWVAHHLSGFDPFMSRRTYEIRAGQRVGELAILLKAYVGLTGDRRSPVVGRVLKLLEAVSHDRTFQDRLARYPGEFILFAQIHACLEYLGIEDSERRAAVQRALDAGYLGHTERLPHRMMDVASCLECGGFDERFATLTELYESSLLSPVPCPIHLNEDSIYAITHIIMFLYDFGLRSSLSVPVEDRGSLAECLSALLIAVCHEHHWDLVAELLVCWDCVGLEPDLVYAKAWEALAQVQRCDGAVPGPEWAAKRHQDTDPAGSPGFDFAHHYHTTLVAVIAGCLRRKREAAGHRSGTGARPADPPSLAGGSGDRRRLLDAAGRANQWLLQWLEPSTLVECARPEVLCRVLLGLWICRCIGTMPQRAFSSAAATVGARLSAQYPPMSPQWSQVPLMLQLMAANILHACGIGVPHLHDRGGAASTVAGSIGQEAWLGDPELSAAQLLLYGLDLCSKPTAADPRAVLDQVRRLPLSASIAEIERCLSSLEALAGHGTRKVTIDGERAWLGQQLAGSAVTMCRKYDLLLGGRALRTMVYLGLSHAMRDQCLSFILQQQRPDGSFGMFGPEASNLPADYPVAAALELPVTVDCLWTIAEAMSDWRLYDSILMNADRRAESAGTLVDIERGPIATSHA